MNRELFLKDLREYAAKLDRDRHERCDGCAYLVENDSGIWICGDHDEDITAIPDEICSMNME